MSSRTMQRVAVAVAAPVLLAGVLGGAIAFAQSGEEATPTPAPKQADPTPAPDDATPATPAAPAEGSKRDKGDCPEGKGPGGNSSGESSGASTQTSFRGSSRLH